MVKPCELPLLHKRKYNLFGIKIFGFARLSVYSIKEKLFKFLPLGLPFSRIRSSRLLVMGIFGFGHRYSAASL